MKKCSACKRQKSFSEFNKNKAKKDGYSIQCRECKKIRNKQDYPKYKKIILVYTKLRKKELKKWFREYKSKLCCEECGYNIHPIALDFHHINPKLKDDIVPNLVNQGYSKKRILSEIEKCKVLCSNCHRIEHLQTSSTIGSASNS